MDVQDNEHRMYLSFPEAAKLLGVSRNSIKTLTRNGVLATLEIPGIYTRVFRAEVEQLLAGSVRREPPRWTSRRKRAQVATTTTPPATQA